ncbi:MAG: tetratricopeptide repeat protein [Spirochaetales bacterium]|nr:tetratricopeptide repeat protein [Spirochaetales bacterium]
MPDFLLLIFIILILVAALIFLFFFTFGKSDKEKKSGKAKKKDKSALFKEANRRLSQNPKDPDALMILADLQFSDNDFEKAAKTYGILATLTATNPNLDEFTINLRYGLSMIRLGQNDEAYKSLLIAKALKPEGFEVNFNLGQLDFLRRNYEKAAAALKVAHASAKDHPGTIKYLGQSLFKLKSYKEAGVLLKRAIDLEPNDKETFFYLAQTYFELGQSENAVKIFMHLRPDPEIGPQASLFAGTIHFNARQYQAAIEDLELGLKHEKVPEDIFLEMKYRLAAAYTQAQNMDAALRQFRDIRTVNPGYKDTAEQIRRLSEFHSNKNLQIYMMAPTSEFVSLCRNLTSTFFPKAAVKIVDVTVNKNEYADITCEISTTKWEDVIMFRFIRTSSPVGELFLRDMQTRLKDVHAGRGFCVTAGSFTQTAKQFVEARLIDLVEKDALLKAMSSL